MWKYTGQQRPAFANETGAGQESVWDYPRPPICVKDDRQVVVRRGDVEIACSSETIRVLETASPPTFYIPRKDVELKWLQLASGQSYCEWKGQATYWSLTIDQQTLPKVGWSYDSPSSRFKDIAGYFSFYPGKLECFVANERVRPQAGGFYGGWVTDEIVGPCKGDAGTQGW